MHIQVLYFGVLKESFGVEQDRVELVAEASVDTLLRSLQGRMAVSPAVWGSMAVAVNRAYASKSTILREGDEVALLPPVSGGVR